MPVDMGEGGLQPFVEVGSKEAVEFLIDVVLREFEKPANLIKTAAAPEWDCAGRSETPGSRSAASEAAAGRARISQPYVLGDSG